MSRCQSLIFNCPLVSLVCRPGLVQQEHPLSQPAPPHPDVARRHLAAAVAPRHHRRALPRPRPLRLRLQSLATPLRVHALDLHDHLDTGDYYIHTGCSINSQAWVGSILVCDLKRFFAETLKPKIIISKCRNLAVTIIFCQMWGSC